MYTPALHISQFTIHNPHTLILRAAVGGTRPAGGEATTIATILVIPRGVPPILWPCVFELACGRGVVFSYGHIDHLHGLVCEGGFVFDIDWGITPHGLLRESGSGSYACLREIIMGSDKNVHAYK